MSSSVNGYVDGERVFHRLWQTTGTVRVVNDDTAKVAWDGLATANELTEALAQHLERAATP